MKIYSFFAVFILGVLISFEFSSCLVTEIEVSLKPVSSKIVTPDYEPIRPFARPFPVFHP